MKGHIRERSPGHFAIVLSIGTGKNRKLKWHSFKGSKRQAQAECARLITGIKEGSYVEPSKLTLADYLKTRLEQWEASKKIGAKTAERYAELINNQIVPHLGAITLQKLTVQDIETWHNSLASSGRQDGKGGLSNRTIGHAHRVLSKALKDASKFDLVMKNVATAQQPPTAEDEEVVIVAENRIKELLAKLSGRSMYPKALRPYSLAHAAASSWRCATAIWISTGRRGRSAKVSRKPKSTASGSSARRPRPGGGIFRCRISW
jgi:Phage integrase, N-terminal SAM-like domain